jgi:ADP-L-glycero-D-manno-heptose 6-epimerase
LERMVLLIGLKPVFAPRPWLRNDRKLGTGDKWNNLVGLQFDDILSSDFFLQNVKSGNAPQASVCIHLGGSSATTEKDADYLLENNYRYTRTLCDWSLRTGVRFVFASTAATYGDGSLGYSDEDTVTSKLRPLNMYA